jgi:hypothetical protein
MKDMKKKYMFNPVNSVDRVLLKRE